MLSQFVVGSMDLPDLPSLGIGNFEPVCRWRCELNDLPSLGIGNLEPVCRCWYGLIRPTLIGIVNF